MTTSRVTTYSADLQTLSVAGQEINSGYADGEFVSAEPAAEGYGIKVGADGEVARFKINNKGFNIKIKLLQTSLGNNILSGLYALGQSSSNGADIGVFELRDRSSGVALLHGDKCWVAKLPTITRGREVAEYEWSLYVAHGEADASGNPSV